MQYISISVCAITIRTVGGRKKLNSNIGSVKTLSYTELLPRETYIVMYYK
jgi:hypothetical protein